MKLGIFCIFLLSLNEPGIFARTIYVNGVDVSGIRNAEMKDVTVKISESGDVFILAPQYQVLEEKTFVPVNEHEVMRSKVKHTPPTQLPKLSTKSEEAMKAPAKPANPVNEEKP